MQPRHARARGRGKNVHVVLCHGQTTARTVMCHSSACSCTCHRRARDDQYNLTLACRYQPPQTASSRSLRASVRHASHPDVVGRSRGSQDALPQRGVVRLPSCQRLLRDVRHQGLDAQVDRLVPPCVRLLTCKYLQSQGPHAQALGSAYMVCMYQALQRTSAGKKACSGHGTPCHRWELAGARLCKIHARTVRLRLACMSTTAVA